MTTGWLQYQNQGATRNLPVSDRLQSALGFLPELGVQMEVFSGGQPEAGEGPRVGSTRHDHGHAADVFFYKDGRKLDWANEQDRPLFQQIVSRAKQNGVTGFGAGDGYMQPGSMHIGFGKPAVWGAGGKGSSAPDWLRQAYDGGEVRVADASGQWTPAQMKAIEAAQARMQSAPQGDGSSGGGLRPLRGDERRLNADGSYSTELEIGVNIDGKEVNIPSLWMGPNGPVEMTPEEAVKAARDFEQRTGQMFPRFDTVEQAAGAAKARSQGGGTANGSLAQRTSAPQWTQAQQAAIDAAQARLQGGASPDPLRPPKGMTAQEAADADVAEAERQSRLEVGRDAPFPVRAAVSFNDGLPGGGQWVDEAIGAIFGDGAMANYRAVQEANQEDAPVLNTVGGVAGGVTGSIAAAGLGALALGQQTVARLMGALPKSAVGQILAAVGVGATAGGVEGAVSGAGAANEGDRGKGALTGGVTGALAGGAVGAVAPAIGAGVRNIVGAVKGRPDAAAVRSMDASPESVSIVGRMLENDGRQSAARNIAEAGPGAMIADAGPATGGLLDAAIQKAGPAGRIARDAIDERANDAGREITGALDQFLGKPRGMKAAARDISGRTAQIRKQAYDKAYASPIDYSAPEGLAVEEVLSRIPPRQLTAAVQEANEEMISRGVRSQQIMAEIGEDGTVAFREMPNVQQLDEIKKALDKAGSVEDIFGRPTAESLRPRRLAKELRKAIGDAAPSYNRAVALGGQKIAEDKALQTGRRILQDNFTVEDVADAMDGAGPELVRQAKIGLRSQINHVMGNVKRAITDSSMDAREGVKAMRELSSRNAREKMAAVLGEKEANALAGRIDRASKAFELRARTADNSKTFARQSLDEAIKETTEPGIVGKLLQGSPLDSAKKLAQTMTNMTPEARRAVEERITGEIATLLTKQRGQAAEAQARRLVKLMERQPVTEAMARRVGRATGLFVAGSGYQTGTQLLGSPQ